MYDLLLKGGEVVDPMQSIHDLRDVGIKDGKIAAVDREITESEAREVIPVSGKLVMPGLIDIHCHPAEGLIKVGLSPDEIGLDSGVTLLCDGGSAGAANFHTMRRFIVERARTHMFCFLNLAAVGLVRIPEVRDQHDIDLERSVQVVEEKRDLSRGIKIRAIPQLAEGIGLYRTEFLSLGAADEPTEKDHYRAYRDVIEHCRNRPVVIRTADLGADKYTQSRQRVPERNPFLGCRSIRYCLQNIPMFKTQIRAILRSSVDSEVSMMFPLISNIMELRQAKTVVRDVVEDLEEEGIEHRNDLPIGMMVETPSAALTIDAFAREVDFFSVGTNDLVQYTLAVDRGNERVASLFSVAHPSVLRLIKDVIRAGQRHDVPVSLCGEMAGDPMYTLLLLGMGLRTFSCAPPAIPEIKKIIRSVTMELAFEISRRVMSFETEKETINFLGVETRKVLPEAYVD